MKRFVSVFALVLITIMVNACAPVITSTLPTFTPVPSLFPSSTASFGFKRVSIKEFIPNLSFDVPLSFEIPEGFVLCQFPDDHDTYFWTPEKCKGDFRPQNTDYFQAKLAFSTYDSQTDRFANVPNDINDKDIISLFESEGAKLNRIERKKIGEFPVLISELELSYEESPGVVKTQLVNRIFIATLVDTNVLWIDYYFYMPATREKDTSTWEHFESSLERIP